jgi:selenocysteine-specific elongation factor
LHTGTSEVGVRVVARDVSASEPFSARLVLDAPVLLRAGDRFVIRTSAPLNTIAGGVVTDPYAPRRARPWPTGLSITERLERLVAESSSDGIEIATLPVRLGAAPPQCRELLADLSDRLVATPTRVVARTIFAEIERQLVEATRQYHATHSLEAGVATQTLREAVHASPEITEAALGVQFANGMLTSTRGQVALAGWAPSPSDAQASLMKTIVSILETAGAEPPSVEELSTSIGQDSGVLIRYLERRGDVVQVEQNRYYAADQLKRLVGRVREALTGGSSLTPSELRDALGLSRKFLIPFLEYCDRAGYTARNVTGRVWHGS